MRILRQIITTVLCALLIGVLSLVVVRAVSIRKAAARLEQSVLELQRDRFSSQILSECRKIGAVESDFEVVKQVRFTSHTEYVQEALCPGFSSTPVTLDKHELPRFVSKLPGTSGFVISDALTGVTLTTFASQQEMVAAQAPAFISKLSSFILVENYPVYFDGSGLAVEPVVAQALIGPPSSCSGFGYTCCNQQSQIGGGILVSGATDCPKTCYEYCQNIPVVLSLRTTPPLDPNSNTVVVGRDSIVSISYVLDVPETSQSAAVVEYGDGETELLLSSSGQLAHTYKCNTLNPCEYTLRLLVDAQLDEQTVTKELATLLVQVR